MLLFVAMERDFLIRLSNRFVFHPFFLSEYIFNNLPMYGTTLHNQKSVHIIRDAARRHELLKVGSQLINVSIFVSRRH